jgi:hypothetical protein
MTDADLIHSISQLAVTDPRTQAGVDAIYTLAKMIAAEPKFAETPRLVRTATGWLGFSAESAAQRMLNIARDTDPRTPSPVLLPADEKGRAAARVFDDRDCP